MCTSLSGNLLSYSPIYSADPIRNKSIILCFWVDSMDVTCASARKNVGLKIIAEKHRRFSLVLPVQLMTTIANDYFLCNKAPCWVHLRKEFLESICILFSLEVRCICLLFMISATFLLMNNQVMHWLSLFDNLASSHQFSIWET